MEEREKHPQHFRAVMMLLVANVFWGLSFPTIKALALIHERVVPGSSSGFITAMLVAPRYVVAALVMVLWQGGRIRRTSRAEWRQGLELGFFMAGGVWLQNDGLQFTSASTSAFLTQFYAILIPVWVALRQRRMPRVPVWLASVLVLAGTAILGGFDWRTLSIGRGEVETLLGSVFFAGQILCLEKRAYGTNDAARVTLVMFGAEAVIFSILGALVSPGIAEVQVLCGSGAWVGLTLLLAGACSVAAINLMNRWQPKISAVEAGLIYCFEPVFGALFALFTPSMYSQMSGVAYPNETVTGALALGGGLITLANLILGWRWKVDPGG